MHIGEPLYSRGPHQKRRPAVKSYCGLRGLPLDEIERVTPKNLDAHCGSCPRVFRSRVEFVGWVIVRPVERCE